MINEEDRKTLIDYRLKQAKETISQSRFLIDSDQLVLAVNRIYYGMFYAVTALAMKHRFETSKHFQLIGWFNKEFVSTEAPGGGKFANGSVTRYRGLCKKCQNSSIILHFLHLL